MLDMTDKDYCCVCEEYDRRVRAGKRNERRGSAQKLREGYGSKRFRAGWRILLIRISSIRVAAQRDPTLIRYGTKSARTMTIFE